jgi:uncharacterized protein (DUF4415 family)
MNDKPTTIIDDENPEWTGDDFARARPGSELLPQDLLAAFGKKRGRPKLAAPKTSVSLRIDPDVLAYYKSTGGGWQGRINDVLRKAMRKTALR